MSEKIKSILTVVVVTIVMNILFSLVSPGAQVAQNAQSQLVGGNGVPSGFDNVNLWGALQVGISEGNPNIMSGFGTGSISATGLITSSSTIYAGNGLLQGGVLSTTTGASMTLRASDFSTQSLISMLPTVGAITVTMPASTTLNSLLPNAGDSKEFVFHNSTTTAAQSITIAGGTGTLLQIASSSAKILPTSSADFRLVRKVNGDVIVEMIPFTP